MLSFLFLGVGCSFQTKDNNIKTEIQKTTTETQKRETTDQKELDPNKTLVDELETKETSLPKVEVIKANEIKNCSNDLLCLVELSKTCLPAKANISYTLDMFGVNYNFTDYYEIKDTVKGKCILYMKTNNVTVSYNKEAKDDLIASGMSEAQISEFEKSGNADVQNNFNGKDAVCIFSQNSLLTQLLTEWQAGDRVSTIITKVAQCSGPLLNATIGGSGSTKINIAD
ncbi:MAG TPA: hypothetical protein DEB09_00450 [Candidatus Magasanikbacteria bacterium]|nr:hypothetical protein [Candidatus Magasanikbacteria bacterium]